MDKKRDIIQKYFNNGTENNKSICLICGKTLSGKTTYNLIRHIINLHPDIAFQLNLIDSFSSDKENTAPTAKKPKTSSVKIEINADTVIRSCLKLVTIHSLPLAVIDYQGFQEIINPIENALGFKINSHNIHHHIKSTSFEFINYIKAETKLKLISLKIDGATRLDRSVLGVNIQFIKNSKIIIRTIAMIQMTERMTSENLKESILKILNKYEISIQQLYSVTTDNGANMLKTVKLLKEHQSYTTVQTNEVDEIFQHFDEVDEDLSLTSTDYNFYEHLEHEVQGILGCVRCAAHTIQLVANAVINQIDITEKLNLIRVIIKKLKSIKYRSLFIINNGKRPVLDVITRWGSTFMMIKSIWDNKPFYIQLGQSDPDIGFSDEQFKFMENFLECFKPIHDATIKFQSSQLTIGDFYKEWLECSLYLNLSENQMSLDLKREMKFREQQLFSSDLFKAAMFLDPRFNYLNSTILSEADKTSAKVHLKKLHSLVNNLSQSSSVLIEASEISSTESSQTLETTEISLVENYLRTKDNERADGAETFLNLENKLNMFCLTKRIHSQENVLEYWERNKYEYPELYQLALIALAVPATQVSVERSFSALSLILTPHRNRLSGDILEDILLIKLNKDLFDK